MVSTTDLAMLYGVETKQINRQVKRNIERFDDDFCFQLTNEEYENLKCQIGTSSLNGHGGRRTLPYVFTEFGSTALAGILRSDIAIKMNKKIIRAFVKMRHYIGNNLLEQKYINNMVLDNNEKIIKHDNEIKLLQDTLDKMQEKKVLNEIYFEGQIYDAYSKVLDILSSAKKEIIIIDAYADKTVLDIISKLNINVILITKTKTLLTKLDLEKYNKQYSNLKIIYNDSFHDRYFILDNKTIYHCGASINHLGNKTFSINLLDDEIVKSSLINHIKELN